VSPDLVGPRVTVGLGWAAITAVALAGGSVTLSWWLGGTAALAAFQAASTWKRSDRRPSPAVAAGVAAGWVVAAGLGPLAFIGLGVVLLGVGVMFGMAAAWAPGRHDGGAPAGQVPADVLVTLACAAVPAAAAVGPVLLRTHGVVLSLVLLSYAVVWDAANWVWAAGSRHPWIGALAGAACIGSVTVGVAGLFPQFKAAGPWELGLIAAVLAPLGGPLACLVVGSPRARVRALRRLDSLVVLGPLWAFAATRLAG